MTRASLVLVSTIGFAFAAYSAPAHAGQYAPGFEYPRFERGIANLRVLVKPKNAQVYVDGFYVGVVEDFNGIFDRLHVIPGHHAITLSLDGYQTATEQIDLAPYATYKLRYTMQQLAPGQARTNVPPPAVAQQPGMRPLPVRPPMQAFRSLPTAPAANSPVGALVIQAQPAGTEILIDGETWTGPDLNARLVVSLHEGSHHIEIRKSGYASYTLDVMLRGGQTTPLNVSLQPRE